MKIALVFVVFAGLAAAADPPGWAYGFPPGGAAPAAAPAGGGGAGRGAAAPPAAPLKLPGGAGEFTPQRIRDGFGRADWFPGDHPTMPEVVAKGRRPDVTDCAVWHLPNGKGRPENAGVSGLPAAYFIQTMLDFRNGNRKSFDSRKANTNRMITMAKAMTDDEIKAAAEYFGSMKWTPWIKVIETES